MQCQSDSLIICNGYKDQSYIELALLAQKMGKRIFIVVEKLNEIDIISKAAKKLGVRPNLGVRIKLASSGSGKWEESGGDASKFGLTSSELLAALEKLEKLNMKDQDTPHTDSPQRGIAVLYPAPQDGIRRGIR